MRQNQSRLGDIVIKYMCPEGAAHNFRVRTTWQLDAALTNLIGGGNTILNINSEAPYDPAALATAINYLREFRIWVNRIGLFEWAVKFPNGKQYEMTADKVIKGALTVREQQVEAEKTSLMPTCHVMEGKVA